MKQDKKALSGQAIPWPGTAEARAWATGKQMRDIVVALASSGLGPEDQEEAAVGKDPWGTDFKLYPDMRGGEGGGDVVRWVIESAGPDKVFGTEDDLERHSAFVTTGSSGLDLTEMDMLEGSMEMEPEAVDLP